MVGVEGRGRRARKRGKRKERKAKPEKQKEEKPGEKELKRQLSERGFSLDTKEPELLVTTGGSNVAWGNITFPQKRTRR